jgi:hypothetical protein
MRHGASSEGAHDEAPFSAKADLQCSGAERLGRRCKDAKRNGVEAQQATRKRGKGATCQAEYHNMGPHTHSPPVRV